MPVESSVIRFYVVRALILCGTVVPLTHPALAAAGTFDVGGIVFTDIDNPLFSGLNGVEVTLEGIEGTPGTYSATTDGTVISGFWVIGGVAGGTYILSMELDGWCFERYIVGLPAGALPVVVIVEAGGRQKFQNLFVRATSSTEPCALGCTEDSECDDSYTCTVDTCEDGLCTNTPIQGCVCNVDLDCDDENPCTAHTCVDNMCNDTDTCDDADVCNGIEQCQITGECLPGEPLMCDDNDACNGLEQCDPLDGCLPGEPLICDGGDVCSGLEQCDEAAGCVPGPPLVCDDGDVCDGVEQCDDTLGCLPGVPLVCDDDDLCNGMYACSPQSGCIEINPPVECDPDEQCDPTDGLCMPTRELPALGFWPMLVLLSLLLSGVVLVRIREHLGSGL